MKVFTSFFIVIICFFPFALKAQNNDPITEVNVHHIMFPYEEIYDYSSWGAISVKYIPQATGKFLNIVALDVNERAVWLLQNIYLHPYSESKTEEESLFMRFNVRDLGYEPYFGMEMVYLSYRVTDRMLLTAPVIDPLEYNLYMVLDFPINAEGGIYPFDIPFNPNQPVREKLTLNSKITSSFNHGCNVSNFDLHDQDDYGGVNGCAPAAAANSLDWLRKENKDLQYSGDLRQAYENLSNLMNRMANQGVSFEDMVRAKLDFIEMYDLPLTVVFQGYGIDKNDSIVSTSGSSSAKCQNSKDRAYPDKRWLYNMGKDKCDVELWLKHSGNNAAHVVTLTGGHIIDDSSVHITFKHDVDQEETDEDRINFWRTTAGTIQEEAKLDEVLGGTNGTELRIKNFKLDDGTTTDVTITGVIAECPNPNYKPRPNKVTFKHFCDNQKIIIPPKSNIVFSYLKEDRCFNSTLYTSKREPDKTRRLNEKKIAVWNWNSGKERRYVNNDSVPVYVTLHNDDNKSPRTPSPNTPGFDIGFKIERNTSENIKNPSDKLLAETSPSNEEEYGGFSIGWRDSSNNEFGDVTIKDYEYKANIGSLLSDFPKVIGPANTNKLTISYDIAQNNKYWSKLSFILGVSKVNASGQVMISCQTTGAFSNVNILGPNIIVVFLGGVPSDSKEFKIRMETINADFEIDYVAVSSEYSDDQKPTILVNRFSDSVFCQNDLSQVNFQIQNLIDPNYFQDGNEFKAQLSDASGSFANPIVIGTVQSKVAVPIDITIPEVIYGDKYRIRVVSTLPEVISTDNGQDLTIFELPMKPSITRNGTNLISSADEGNQWFFNSNMIAGANQKIYDTKNVEGDYSVQVTSAEGCISEMSDTYKYVIESVIESEYITNVSIIPNPAEEFASIFYTLEQISNVEIYIVNLFGNRLVNLAKEIQSAGDYKMKLSIKEINLLSGVYYIVFEINGNKIVRNLCVIRQ
jgi:hypothetical protein